MTNSQSVRYGHRGPTVRCRNTVCGLNTLIYIVINVKAFELDAQTEGRDRDIRDLVMLVSTLVTAR